jgi:two-component sensor histidine kinase
MALIAGLQRVIKQEPGLPSTTLWVAFGIALATAVRELLNPLLGSTLWYPTYYPVTLICTLFLGWKAGAVVVLLSAVVAGYLFVPPQFRILFDGQLVAGTLTFIVADGLIVLAAGLLRSTLVRLQIANQLEARLNAELQHRMKNTLAIVQAKIHQTGVRYSDIKEFQRSLYGRITALSNAHDLLSSGRWEICKLPALCERALEPFRGNHKIALNGPPCELDAECCVPLVLALHELATNAFKYGALSAEDGTVQLSWSLAGDTVLLRWIERGGPTVTEPTRRGLGSRLVASQKGLDAVTIKFKPEGVECVISVKRAMVKRGVDSPTGAAASSIN